MSRARLGRRFSFAFLALAASILTGASGMLFGVCGPFTDVSDAAFCPFVLEIFTLGITTGTTPTTYDPASAVSRLQMAAFLSRAVDGTVRRVNRRAALGRFWNPQNETVLALTTVGTDPLGLASDGTDVWVAHFADGRVSRVRAGDGRLLETWTGASEAAFVLIATGRVLVTGRQGAAGKLYAIDPTQPAGVVTTVATLPGGFGDIAFDGARVWTLNHLPNCISIVTPGAIPWTSTTVTTGVTTGIFNPEGILFDGVNIWVSDTPNRALRVDSSGAVLQVVTVGDSPESLVSDGTNIWVPGNASDNVTVFRAQTGTVLRTLTGNGLKDPFGIAFDGERILVANFAGDTVSLWKAADLTPLGSVLLPGGSGPNFVCSDGTSFWVTLNGSGNLARF